MVNKSKSAPNGSAQRTFQSNRSAARGGKGGEGLIMKGAERILGEHAKQVQKRYKTLDPRYAEDVNTGERVERLLPPGLSEKDQKILKTVRKRARNLDYGINLCGLRFGRSTIFGLCPGAGPIIDIVLGVCLINLEARKVDLPWKVALMMYVRHCLSEGVGLVPGFGDIFIAWYKANSRNSWALERFLEERGAQNLREKETKGGNVTHVTRQDVESHD